MICLKKKDGSIASCNSLYDALDTALKLSEIAPVSITLSNDVDAAFTIPHNAGLSRTYDLFAPKYMQSQDVGGRYYMSSGVLCIIANETIDINKMFYMARLTSARSIQVIAKSEDVEKMLILLAFDRKVDYVSGTYFYKKNMWNAQ